MTTRPFFARFSFAQSDLFTPLIFFYFFTLHADRLGFSLGGFNIRINNLLAFCLTVMFLIRFRKEALKLNKELLLALCGLTLSILLSQIFSSFKVRSIYFLCWYGFTCIVYFLLPYLLVSKWDAEHIFSLYCFSFVVVGLYALSQLILSFFHIYDPFTSQVVLDIFVRPNALSYEPSFYALYMSPFIALCNFHYLTTPHAPFFCFRRLGIWKVLFFNFLFLLSTSTSAFIFYVFFFITLSLQPFLRVLRIIGLKFLIYFVCGSLVGCAAFPFLMRTFFLKYFYFGFMTHISFYERWIGIANGWNLFKMYPFLGVGLGGYPAYLKEAWLSGDTTFKFCTRQLIERAQEANFCKAFEASNVLMELLASLGVVGLTAVAALFFVFYKNAKRAFSHPDPQTKLLVINFFVSICVMLMMLQINQGLLRTYVWVHFGLLFGLIDRIQNHSQAV